MAGRFEVDTDGFRVQMSEMPIWRLIQEIISNSFDEKSVSKIECKIESMNEKLYVEIHDDGDGFKDVRDVYTLFKDSYKRVNSKQRGRFNLGDKQFFAVAESGHVYTGNHIVNFVHDKREVIKTDTKHNGVTVTGVFESFDDVATIESQLQKVIVPDDKKLLINNVEVSYKKPIKSFKAVLRTPKANGANSKLVLIKQETDVVLYEKNHEEKPILFELGVPVQYLEEKINWNVDVRQKIPIPTSRDVVSDAYLQSLYAEVLENTTDLITTDNAGSIWVNVAMKQCSENSARKVLEKVYGTDKVMIESSTDHRANEKAKEAGFILIQGSTLDPSVRENIIKKHQIIQYAGKAFETTYGDAEPVEPNQEMLEFARIVESVAYDVTGRIISCEFFSMKDGADVANYGGNSIGWNVGILGKKFFNKFSARATGILIHELAHAIDRSDCGQYSHLKMEYLRSIEKVAGIVAEKGIQYWINKEIVVKN